MTESPGITVEDFSRRRFDFIVIGGGTSGLAVAARLSEQPDVQVGVLEAGPDVHGRDDVDIPGLYGRTMGSDLDWHLETEPQPGLGGRRLPWTRGKVLGGTSALNFMGWNRASREDYDAWVELGCTGWGWDDLLPYFKKTETFHPPSPEFQEQHKAYYDADGFGTSGPVQISYAAEFSASHRHWHETMANLGVATNRRHLMGANVGAYTKVASVDPRSATRSYAASAYYRPARGRPNLVVLTGALVSRIVLEEEQQQQQGEDANKSWRATGVQFTHQGDDHIKRYWVSVTTAAAGSGGGEVVLCAGSTQSPQLLELSGVGDPGVLARAGVAAKVASPAVGENLQDHVMAMSVYEVDPALPTRDDLLSTDNDGAAAREAARAAYDASRSGPLTVLANSVCYVPLAQVMPAATLAGLRARARALVLHDDDGDGLRDAIRRRRLDEPSLGHIEYFFELGNLSPYYKGDDKKKYGTVLQILQYPLTRGSVHIRSADPRAPPVVDPRYYRGLGGALDRDVMVACARFADRITRTRPLAGIVRGRVAPPVPAPVEGGEEEKKTTTTTTGSGSDEDKDDDGEYWKDWLARESTTDWHPIGTCSMGGRRGVAGGVVDERLRVYGVAGLRVVDASIMPLQIGAHPQATVYAIAEKGASMILEDRRRSGAAAAAAAGSFA